METKNLNYTAEEIGALLEKIENLQPVELPQSRFVYQTGNTFNPVAGDFAIGIYKTILFIGMVFFNTHHVLLASF